jgi:hypothetical protein
MNTYIKGTLPLAQKGLNAAANVKVSLCTVACQRHRSHLAGTHMHKHRTAEPPKCQNGTSQPCSGALTPHNSQQHFTCGTQRAWRSDATKIGVLLVKPKNTCAQCD